MSWEKIELGEICSKIGSGATPKGGKSVYIDSGVHQIRSQNVRNLQFDYDGLVCITDEAAKKLSGVTVEPDDVLLNITGDSVARVCQVPDEVLPARVNQHVAIVRPDKDKVRPRFLSYYLASPFMQSYMLKLANGKGASRNALTKDMIAAFRVPCPSLDTQDSIIDVLSAYDNLIEKNRRQIALLEEAADLTYANWLNACDSSSFGTGTMSDFFDVTIGKTPPRAQTECFVAEGVPWASVKDLGNTAGPFISSTSECLTDEAIGNYKVKVKPAGTILLSFKLTIGRVAIAKQPTATNEAIAHFATDNDAMRLYTYEYLRSFDYDTLGSTSSIGKAINSKIVKAIPFSLPRESDLNQLYAQLNPLFCSMRLCQQRVTLLAEARDRLLPKLMSDEIEVSE